MGRADNQLIETRDYCEVKARNSMTVRGRRPHMDTPCVSINGRQHVCQLMAETPCMSINGRQDVCQLMAETPYVSINGLHHVCQQMAYTMCVN